MSLKQQLMHYAVTQFGDTAQIYFLSEKDLIIKHNQTHSDRLSISKLVEMFDCSTTEAENLFVGYWSKQINITNYKELQKKLRYLDSFDFRS
ncbi:hypothetical protein A6E01_19650 (plasmid) [Vibrio breoganii]|uniref:Uncharacterized protein n=1 Tax=Vibrio breoganii TaxID=553239 RepID=A0AAN0XZB5_9VIBR|nr:hypothetical protein [Vibrio breoganii]ANO35430.1 hypothetical protein A6E01_19650 [Vibrio breoganii]